MGKSHYFDFYWEKAILPAINQCYEEASSSIKESFDLKYKNLNMMKKKIENTYINMREMYKIKYHAEGRNAVLDYTKLSSIICYSLLENKIFTYNKNYTLLQKEYDNELLVNDLLINYKLAFISSTFVVLLGLMNDCIELKAFTETEKNKILLERLINNNSIKMYEFADSGKDPFYVSAIKHLAIFDLNSLDFDCMTYALLMDGLKEYNKIYFLNYEN